MRFRSQAAVAAACVLGVAFVLRSATLIPRSSVTVDEFAHLPAGLAYLTRQEFAVYATSPPLLRMIQALPVLALHPTLPPLPQARERLQRGWALGYLFQNANREGYRRLFAVARGVNVLLGAMLLLVVFAWSRRAWGTAGGIASLALCAVDPNLTAHAALATTDVGFCVAVILALWAAERMLAGASRWSIVVCGLALGAAELTKFTALLLYPAILLAALACARPLRPALARLAAACAMSVLVVNAGYAFQGTRLLAPLPAAYLSGLEAQAHEADARYASYLNGTVHRAGAPWYYDLETLALKTPFGELAVFGATLAGFLLVRRRLAPRGGWLIVALAGSTAALLLISASLTPLDLGVRYVMLVYPLGALAAGGLVRIAPRGIGIAIALAALESFAAYPRDLGFFNAAAGGTSGGYRFLADSNLDWGQDLPALRERLQELRVDRVRLAYFGRVDPRLYGIEYEPLGPGALQPGWYAVSINFVVGLPYVIVDPRSGASRWLEPGELAAFGRIEPAARAGSSILLYHLP